MACEGSYKVVAGDDKTGFAACPECGNQYSLHTRPKANIIEVARGAIAYSIPEHSSPSVHDGLDHHE